VIRIKKPSGAPAALRSQGSRATRKLCEQIEGDPEGYRAFRFKKEIYAHPSVKEALRRAQHGKCALCESRIDHVTYGDVEHFRPKAGYCQEPKDSLVQPGYYWLAYDWSNLLLCCQLCNQRFKRNHFPLAEPSRRARSHRDDISQEEPLLIHPAVEDPANFLEFRENVIRAIDENPRGEATIRSFGLDRPELEDQRLARFSLIRRVIPIIEQLIEMRDRLSGMRPEAMTADEQRDLAEAEAAIEQFMGDSAEYAAMVRAALNASRGGSGRRLDWK
jgi:uncharacterized protein (TIGR02646 family)